MALETEVVVVGFVAAGVIALVVFHFGEKS
jgi:hypothetical protein